jgi:hypothetical protein
MRNKKNETVLEILRNGPTTTKLKSVFPAEGNQLSNFILSRSFLAVHGHTLFSKKQEHCLLHVTIALTNWWLQQPPSFATQLYHSSTTPPTYQQPKISTIKYPNKGRQTI